MAKKRIMLYAVIALVVLAVFGVNRLQPVQRSITVDDCFDTISEITVFSRNDKPLRKCEDYMKKMNAELSANDENSAVARLNRGERANLSADAQELLEFGRGFTADNSEYFSIYLYPLEKAWDVRHNPGQIPDVDAALAASKEEREIALGAVAKGYVTDRLAGILRGSGVTSAMINLGGNTYALGTKPNGSPWKIAVQNPRDENSVIGTITAENLAVITSGDYQRFFELDGVRYHHIFDPTTGYPVNNGLHSVTVIAENAALADALSTAAFVAGVENGHELLKKYGARGIFITDDVIYFSKSLEDIFKQMDFSYKYQFLY